MVSGAISVFGSIILFFNGKKSLSIYTLLFGGLLLRIFISILDNHLGIWDEQFHALVAKNMGDNFFRPELYKNQVINIGSLNWANSQVWLHKQPLFLWQMALSIKVFGYNALAVRIPSIILSVLTIGLIYRIGKLSVSRSVGFYSAFLFSISFFSLEIVSGTIATDHNDISFLFYVTASLWAWTEYQFETNKKTKWIILIGLFVGCSVLVKWLTGLVIFSGWFASIIFFEKNKKEIKNYLHLLASFAISVLVFLP